MTARHKLNLAHVNGSMILGAVIGAATESVTVFLIMTLFFVASGIYSRNIRY
ncbi:MAG: hypothetical protein ACK47R_16340 [Planctomycetia bacterium]